MANKGNSFILGIAGGVVGCGIVLGGVGLFNHFENEKGHSTSDKETKTSEVNYDVNTDVTKVVEKVQGAVVSVINLQKAQSKDDMSTLFGSLFGQQEEQQPEQDKNSDKELQEASEGSGVIYKKDNGEAYIVTNNHVVDGSDALQVVLNNGHKVKAKLVGKDEYSDLAVLKINAKDVTTVATFGNSNKIKVGEPAIAIGSPLGSDYANTVTEGIISAKNRTITTKSENGGTVSINAIQTDAAINPGNSGGPLINMAGQVIGINSIKISNSDSMTSVEGMGFAIPSNDVVSIINKLEKDGKVERPALGVTMLDLSYVSPEQQKEILKVPESVQEGVVVSSVQPNSPAEKAGLKAYDVIVKVGNHDVKNTTDLQSTLYKYEIGDTIPVTFYRQDKKETVKVKLTMSNAKLKQSTLREQNSRR